MGLLGDWKVTGITTDGAKVSYPFYALANATDENLTDGIPLEDLKNIGKLFLECKQYFDLYFDGGVKKYKTDAIKFLVQVASYTMSREGKAWSWQEVRHLSQGLYESMEKSPAHFLNYNTPLINNIVAEIDAFIDINSEPENDNDGWVYECCRNSKNMWTLGAILNFSLEEKKPISEKNKSNAKPLLVQIDKEYKLFKKFMEDESAGSKKDFAKFVVTFNALDGGVKTGSVDKWSPETVGQLALTFFLTHSNDHKSFIEETLPFVSSWTENFITDPVWK
jgi:hypothetical protein